MAKSRRNYTSPLEHPPQADGARPLLRNLLYEHRDCSLRASPGCRDFYDRRRAAGDLHHQARALAIVGYLHGSSGPGYGHRLVPTTRTSLLDPLESWGVYPATAMEAPSAIPIRDGLIEESDSLELRRLGG